jgi:hypothetical protein
MCCAVLCCAVELRRVNDALDSRDGNATRKGAGINKSNATQKKTENFVQGAGMEENRIGYQEADMEYA